MSTIETFDYSANILKALLWRNNAAPNITALIQDKQNNFNSDSRDFWTAWAADVFDIRTANEFGLNVWSIILGFPISITPTTPPAANSNWGFGANRFNFNNGNFTPLSGFPLTLEDARIVLRLRYYQLTTNGNISSLNLLLADLFLAQGLAYVVDGLDMTLTYVFDFVVPSSLQGIFSSLDILPRPAGVSVSFTSL